MTKQKKPPVPLSGIIYGEIVYWITIFSAVIVILGTVKTFLEPDSSLPPAYILEAVLSGQSVSSIWVGTEIGGVPEAHWYFSFMSSGEGLTTAGLALGVFSIIPATIVTSLFLWRSRNEFFAGLALAAAIITVTSMTGIIPLPIG
tara:strand:- start:190 stop:624 length:435 start_codon:yes stop_codon:yes gene_type:complete